MFQPVIQSTEARHSQINSAADNIDGKRIDIQGFRGVGKRVKQLDFTRFLKAMDRILLKDTNAWLLRSNAS